jgi:endonuclease/exonuclease/phosphatase family metal-dependent hydrolase
MIHRAAFGKRRRNNARSRSRLGAKRVECRIRGRGVAAASEETDVPQPGPELRVMSFNILNARAGQHAGRWANRRQAVTRAIRAFGPDLLGVQEAQRFQVAWLRRTVREYACIASGRRNALLAGECVALLYRADRFEKLDSGHFWLSKTPDVPRSRHGMSLSPRVVSWVALRDGWHGGAKVFFFNTHFDPFSRRARFRSARILRDRIASLAGPEPAIVTGDFNANAGRKLYLAVLDGLGGDGLRLLDAYRCVHPMRQRNEGTWHGRGIRLRRRLDWVLHTPHFVATEAEIDQAKRNGRYPSDHFPVTATLRW